jgi:polysaccharide pyruvyl transferase WcaK-like protein
MKLLVNHSSGNNLGDMAMIEGVVRRLIHTRRDIHLHVRDNFSLPTEIWTWRNVTRVVIQTLTPKPISDFSWIKKIPYLRRKEAQIKETGLRCCYPLLGRGLNAHHLQIAENRSTLADWCSEYDAMHFVGMGGFADVFMRDVWYYCSLVHAFTGQRKPVIFTGQQIGPIYAWWTRDLIQRTLRQTEFLGLREPTDSLAFCKASNLQTDRFAVMGDDSFGLPSAPLAEVQAILAKRGLTTNGFIAVNLRIAGYAGAAGNYTQKIAEILNRLSKKYELPILVVPIALDEYDSDITSGYLLAEAIADERVQILDQPEELNAAWVKGILGQAYAAIGVSYHFCTFALSQGVPAICIYDGDYYSQKAKGISQFWQDQRLALSLNQIESEDAIRQISGLIEDQKFREDLKIRAETAIAQWTEIFDRKVDHMLSRWAKE